MESENFKFFGIPGVFFLLGVLFLLISANGERNAVIFSRPNNASSWTTSDSLINAFTLDPMIIGISFLILFIITFSISFYKALY